MPQALAPRDTNGNGVFIPMTVHATTLNAKCMRCRYLYLSATDPLRLLGTWSEIIHHCVPLPGPLTLLKVDTTSAFQHLTSKPKEIEYCDE